MGGGRRVFAMHKTTRREFLKRSGVGVAGLSFLPSKLLSHAPLMISSGSCSQIPSSLPSGLHWLLFYLRFVWHWVIRWSLYVRGSPVFQNFLLILSCFALIVHMIY